MPGVYGCGRSNYGQQSSGATSNVTSFTQRLANETIEQVACTTNTTWAVTTDGKLYGCGRSNYGQQGSDSTSNVTSFTQRLANETFSQVACSLQTTWAFFVTNVTVHIKVSGAWKSGKPYVKVNGTWKEATKVLVKVNGTWKESV